MWAMMEEGGRWRLVVLRKETPLCMHWRWARLDRFRVILVRRGSRSERSFKRTLLVQVCPRHVHTDNRSMRLRFYP